MILNGQIHAESIVTPVQKFNDDLLNQYDLVMQHPEVHIKLGVEY
jgi:hypothetical protein